MFQDTMDDPNLIVVAFRGTHPFDPEDWRTDVDLSWFELEGVGKIHSGFMKALGLQKDKGWPKEIEQGNNQRQFAYYEIRQRLRDLLQKNEKAKFIVTGHSLGAALAILFLTVLAKHEEEWLMDKLEGVYTFGQPRVGDSQMGDYMKKKLKQYNVRYLRFVYCNDIVPRIPYDDETRFFTHFGPCLYYNSFYKGKVLPEEPNKNYFSVSWAIYKYLNAVWELIRSFIIPYMMGPEYKEGWLMTMMRMIGLVIPGFADHCPQDYVNATRLGSLPPCLHQ
uniref:Fungal lipase-type domain-containing protein n=1 Tax=Fagus sylvatica TaxID=28930 RepID=A0A2N9FZ24_FAGSY